MSCAPFLLRAYALSVLFQMRALAGETNAPKHHAKDEVARLLLRAQERGYERPGPPRQAGHRGTGGSMYWYCMLLSHIVTTDVALHSRQKFKHFLSPGIGRAFTRIGHV